ncbi:formyltetrahydrofolate deformylase [Haloquadratum walsbyi]|uniref:Formyltetrahydrofolate deformylase n=1 Tax=Haloquadratum walsbyi (strain DSM 16854 / JCM 12705 / C23) TaxID=768065 RepID=G0LMU3_HALWC|nr:formyltetrahydrofolate deformylase [Haloquadratum walsbyi]CCC41413.1 formyltetrahydrofolate deformylase [Haloquadratum walsbyi C23]
MTGELTEITVVGDDKTGIVANITTLLFERGINIVDIDQAIREGMFRMTLRADIDEMVCTESTLRETLTELGDDLEVDIQIRFPTDRETKRIAVFVTKESHCLQALLEAHATGELDAELSVVIGNHGNLEPLVTQYEIPFVDIGDDSGIPDEDQMLSVLDEYQIDLAVLARYMRILSPKIVFRYEDRIINVHPSLLPSFPGAAAYRQAKEEGVRIAGVTAHYVTTDLDQGPIITQRAFDVPDDADVETIRNRGQPLEADALLEAIELHLNNTISVHRGRTGLHSGTDSSEYQLGLPKDIEAIQPDDPIDTHESDTDTTSEPASDVVDD